MKSLFIDSVAIGCGLSRAVYLHPDDSDKVVKISHTENKVHENKREIGYYKQLQKRKLFDWSHMPRFYGEVTTNKGKGMIVECVRDFDGAVSKPLGDYLKENGLEPYCRNLQAFKNYFLERKIFFNNDISPSNILLKRISPTDSKLVLIDGIGDVVYIKALNYIKYFANAKILRRWARFEMRLGKFVQDMSIKNISAVLLTCDAARTIEQCLQALAVFEEVVVCDTGSSDDTIARAMAYPNVHVFEIEFNGFDDAKRVAVAKATCDWIFFIDSDEIMDAELCGALALWDTDSDQYRLGLINRRNFFMGRHIKHGSLEQESRSSIVSSSHAQVFRGRGVRRNRAKRA